VRWRIVSHDARVSSASRRGSGVFRFCLGIVRRWNFQGTLQAVE
jgi:hypothetical protein